jgi:hypothetical protein
MPEMQFCACNAQRVCYVLLAAAAVNEFHLWKQFAKLNFVLRIAISHWLDVVLVTGGGRGGYDPERPKKLLKKIKITNFIA